MACPYSPAVLPALETRATRLGRKVSEVGHGLGGVAVAGEDPIALLNGDRTWVEDGR